MNLEEGTFGIKPNNGANEQPKMTNTSCANDKS